MLGWLRSHVARLPDFVGGNVDFGALAGASSFTHLVRHGGYEHLVAIQKEKIGSSSELGEYSSKLWMSVQNFISSF